MGLSAYLTLSHSNNTMDSPDVHGNTMSSLQRPSKNKHLSQQIHKKKKKRNKKIPHNNHNQQQKGKSFGNGKHFKAKRAKLKRTKSRSSLSLNSNGDELDN